MSLFGKGKNSLPFGQNGRQRTNLDGTIYEAFPSAEEQEAAQAIVDAAMDAGGLDGIYAKWGVGQRAGPLVNSGILHIAEGKGARHYHNDIPLDRVHNATRHNCYGRDIYDDIGSGDNFAAAHGQ